MLKRLLRFRLRGLLILVTVVACGAGWYAWAARQRSRDISVLMAIDDELHGYIYPAYDDDQGPWCGTGMGGFATFEWHGPPEPIKSLLVACDNRAFYRLISLSIYGGGWGPLDRLSSESIEQLARLKSLERLEVNRDDFPAAVLDRLRQQLPSTDIIVEGGPDREEDLARRLEVQRNEERLETAPTAGLSGGGSENPFSGNSENLFEF